MKLTKKIEQEVLKVYITGWDAYMKGDLKTHAACLSRDFKIIGTTEGENFSSKKAWLAFCKKTMRQVVGVVQMRNRKIRLEAVGDGVMVMEHSALYVLMEGKWRFYSKLRVTALMRKEKSGWKYVHQHGSLPDTRASENETIATEKIKKENQQLREAVKRRTIELEEKNRELEIEAALERVRARTMAMQKSDELTEVASLLFRQIKDLGINAWTTGFNIWSEDNNSYVDYVTDPEGNFIEPYTVDTTLAPVLKDVREARKRGEEFYVNYEEGEAIKETYRFLMSFGEKGQYEKLLESGFRFPTQQYEHFVFGSKVSLLFITYESAPATHDIFKRFGKVFEQTYTRFLDLQKAETQAREALIEAALEKVRSRSLAMHQSDELKEVVVVVFQKLKELELTFDVVGIQLYTKGTRDIVQWVAALDLLSTPVLARLPYSENDFMESQIIRDIWTAKEKGESFHNRSYSFEEKNKFFEYAGRNNDTAAIPNEVRKFQMQAPGYTQTLLSEKHSALWVDSYTGQTISVDEFNILGRFGRVFEQAYVRFLDLQKAEAQARESEIELALERVRARAMAMQKSEDLREVVKVLYEQLANLKFQWGAASITIMDSATGDMDWWLEGFGGGYDLPESYHVPFFKHRGHEEQLNNWKNGVPYAVIEIAGSDKKSYDQYYFNQTDFKKAPEETKQLMQQQEAVLFSMAYMRYGALSWSPTPISEEQSRILQRFASVFEQTYTRFLDLQKAEAQAREAKIETALEKIRSRSLAMHHSDELREVIGVTYRMLDELKVEHGTIAIQVFDFNSKDSVFWPGNNLAEVAPKVELPFDEEIMEADTCHRDLWQAMAKGEPILNKVYTKKQKNQWFEYVFAHNDSSVIEDSARDFILGWESHTVCFFPEKYSGLFADSWDGTRYSEADIAVLKRVAKVFEQAYVRFLDLQKVEAQAKEAQIEAALERVRSRSMAMHKSEELSEVASVLFHQLQGLGIDSLRRSAVNIMNESEAVWECWYTSLHGDSFAHLVRMPVLGNPAVAALTSSWQKQELYKVELAGAALNDFMQFLISHGWKYAPGDSAPQKFTMSGLPFSHGVVLTFTSETLKAEEIEILKRFAIVFEQCYTRFLDLQKAEVQTRESEIELALERVRARTMAMQKSEDLREVVKVLYVQLKELGFKNGLAAINIMDPDSGDVDSWSEGFDDGYDLPEKYRVPYFEHNGHRALINHWRSGAPYAEVEIAGQDKKSFDNYYFFHTDFVKVPEATKQFMMQPESILFSMAYMQYGALTWAPTPISEEQSTILQRFAKVFEQTYTRFLDLQKAEEQAREAKVQLALERIRARTMAMQSSDELGETATILFEQIKSLDVKLWAATFDIWKPGDSFALEYAAGPDGKFIRPFKSPINYEDPATKYALQEWEKGSKLIEVVFSGEAVKEGNKRMMTQPETKDIFEAIIATGYDLPEYQVNHFAVFSHGFLQFITTERCPQAHDIFIRMASVFEQTYTRFLDLQKAEAQAREAQIEAALERVRAQAMAMHHTDDLGKTIRVYYEQLSSLLNSKVEHCGAGILNTENTIAIMSTASKNKDGEIYDVRGVINMNGHPMLQGIYSHWLEQKECRYVLRGQEINEYYQYLTNQVAILENKGKEELHFYFPMFKEGSFYVVTNNAMPESELQVFRRFSSVLSLTYRRFNDLLKAEAQAREAQIEAGLEKVRSRTMAMQSSDELQETAAVLFKEFKKLGAENAYQVTIGIYDEEKGLIDFRVTSWAGSGEQEDRSFHLDMNEPVVLQPSVAAWKANKKSMVFDLTGEKLEQWIEYRNKMSGVTISSQDTEGRRVISIAYFSKGHISLSSPLPLPEETIKTLERFATVFDGTYTRFLDLQKAEAQAREAQIEAALERFRSRSMAMQKSSDLRPVVNTLYGELNSLHVNFDVAGIQLLLDDSKDMHLWLSTEDGLYDNIIHWPYVDIRSFHEIHRARQTGEADYLLTEEETKIFFEEYFKLDAAPKARKAVVENVKVINNVGTYQKLTGVFLMRFTESPYSSIEKDIVRRFSIAFEQTYTRFLDLQRAEAQAAEAVKRASVDRVRAEIASMRTKQDLDRITPLIWRELTTLGVPFIRCGVFIMDDEEQAIHTFLSTPDGKAIAAFHLSYQSTANLAEAVNSWRNHKRYVINWKENDFQSQADTLVKEGAIATREQYLSTIPKDGIYLHFLPFQQGMLYVGNTTELSNDNLDLIQSVADAFSTAYARYEDFNKLEAAKAQVDNALKDLKATQTQLVQSEKMASLGELTAGIAHEIQNPLNFVNNFSEVSNELIKEVQDIRLKIQDQSTNSEEDDLLKDIADNLEKISHHGKRASDIVKSMLQHSRASSGQKELTDINALCDEYLRLSYHGYRAKDKSFNAKFETDFDGSIPKIKVVPQDIGRVVLNLINNAFYAVNEKFKVQGSTFQPLVIVSTKSLGNKIEISVKDNGSGMPEHIKEKIFQPFFTTKPTGQGTGLGLSLSYDIVKAHGGEVTVQTKEGEVTEFTILLTA